MGEYHFSKRPLHSNKAQKPPFEMALLRVGIKNICIDLPPLPYRLTRDPHSLSLSPTPGHPRLPIVPPLHPNPSESALFIPSKGLLEDPLVESLGRRHWKDTLPPPPPLVRRGPNESSQWMLSKWSGVELSGSYSEIADSASGSACSTLLWLSELFFCWLCGGFCIDPTYGSHKKIICMLW